MPGTTSPTYIHTGDWDASSRSHPALAWFEPVVSDIFDAHAWSIPSSTIYTANMSLLKPDGTIVTGGDAAWAEVAKMFGMFVKQRTVPEYTTVVETDYGWESFSTAWVYGDLPGQDGKEEPGKVKDHEGGEWDVRMSGAFRFQFVKDAGGPREPGMLIKRVEIMTDSMPVVGRMLGRGLVKPQELGLA